MSVQCTPRKSIAKQAAVARRLNASIGIAKHVLDATVEILDESRDIIYKHGKYGELFLVRSPKFATRYYPVNRRNGAWTCTADRDSVAYFINQAKAYSEFQVAKYDELMSRMPIR